MAKRSKTRRKIRTVYEIKYMVRTRKGIALTLNCSTGEARAVVEDYVIFGRTWDELQKLSVDELLAIGKSDPYYFVSDERGKLLYYLWQLPL